MKNMDIHGELKGAKYPQTYCGKIPFGHKISTEPDMWTCEGCISVWNKTHKKETPNEVKSDPVEQPEKRGRGRPKGRSAKGTRKAPAHQNKE